MSQGRFKLMYKIAVLKEDKTYAYEQKTFPLESLDLNEMTREALDIWNEVLNNFDTDENSSLDFPPKDPVVSYDGVAFTNLK